MSHRRTRSSIGRSNVDDDEDNWEDVSSSDSTPRATSTVQAAHPGDVTAVGGLSPPASLLTEAPQMFAPQRGSYDSLYHNTPQPQPRGRSQGVPASQTQHQQRQATLPIEARPGRRATIAAAPPTPATASFATSGHATLSRTGTSARDQLVSLKGALPPRRASSPVPHSSPRNIINPVTAEVRQDRCPAGQLGVPDSVTADNILKLADRGGIRMPPRHVASPPQPSESKPYTAAMIRQLALRRARRQALDWAAQHARRLQGNQGALEPSFRKRSVGPLKNPNYEFLPGFPPELIGRHIEDDDVFEWLSLNGWIYEGQLLSEGQRDRYLAFLEHEAREAERQAGFSEHEAARKRGGRGDEDNDEDDGQKPGGSYRARAMGFDGTSDEPPKSSSTSANAPAPSTSRRRGVTFTLGTSASSTQATLNQDRDRSSSDPPPPTSIIDFALEHARRDQPEQRWNPENGYPVVVQVGRNDFNAPPRWDQLKPKPYVRSWGQTSDSNLRLAYERAMEDWVKKSQGPDPIMYLSEAVPPTEPLEAPTKRKSSHKSKTRSSSTASSQALETLTSLQIDTKAIELTPRSMIPIYPASGTADNYRAQIKFPYLTFDRNGLLMRSSLSNKVIERFRDSRFAPIWAHAIPNHYAARVEAGVDLEADAWVRFWETLVIKSDLRRGGKLASEAARLLWEERSR